MAADEWDLRVALKAYEGMIDADRVAGAVASLMNSPFFAADVLADVSAQNVVRRTWWEFSQIDPDTFSDGREYLLELMDLANRWYKVSSHPQLNNTQRSLLRYNTALIMATVSEVLGASDD